MFVYESIPIDFFWEQLKTVSVTAGELALLDAAAKANGTNPSGAFPDPAEFLKRWETAKDLAANVGWEGDFRNEPVVFWVPHEDSFDYGFVIKQDNNGATYVISPVRLESLRN
ncbi:hypothetical protein GTP46_04600 [Duganella sp. FT135W]|uniref:Uncharacterized protein n=1 Tax=Duganella flavida TaxID=2692175 RepID=A0A6L8KBZ1_9BURK|nr:hypothetical protein [Duganella flavida]MYM21931.1 hypothetical protein [Duganella flavida]